MNISLRAARRTNLTAPLTSFVGREREVAAVRQLLARTRLVTLTGAGGSGKTRLAKAVAGDLIDGCADEVWLVDLAPLPAGASPARAALDAFGLAGAAGEDALATLSARLAGRHAVLLLDNCEHLVHSCARFADEALRRCPGLRILATSRERLGIAAETAWPVPPLTLPEAGTSPAAVASSEAGRLFLERARAVDPAFESEAESAPALAEICRRLDGMPLAIELAAARVRVLSVQQIAARLDDRFRLLNGGDRSAPDRQRTLEATVDWSYDLLAEPARRLLARLAVFAGGWTIEAAEAVCPGDDIPADDVLDLLTDLVDRSLVVVERAGAVIRYQLLETIRHYALGKLAASGETDGLRTRHRDWCLTVVERIHAEVSATTLVEHAASPAILLQERANIEAALRWCEARREAGPALRIGAVLSWLWAARHPTIGRRRLEGLLGMPGAAEPSVHRAQALDGAARIAFAQMDAPAMRAFAGASIAIQRQLGDRIGLARSLRLLGIGAILDGEVEPAEVAFQEILSIGRDLGDLVVVWSGLDGLCSTACHRDDDALAQAYGDESLAAARALDDRRQISNSLNQLGFIAWRQGDHAAARRLQAESLVLRHALREGERTIAAVLDCLVAIAAELRKPRRALRLYGAVGGLRNGLGIPLFPSWRDSFAPSIARARQALGPEAAAVEAEGRAMGFEEMVAYALTDDDTTPGTSASRRRGWVAEGWAALTPREREVAALVAEGLSNRQVAERLVIAERTASNHLDHIFAKLGLHNRSQVVALYRDRVRPVS